MIMLVMAVGEITRLMLVSTYMITVGTTLAVASDGAAAGPIHIGDGTTGAMVATVGVGTDGIDGTTGVGAATAAGTTGVGEVTVTDTPGALLTDTILITVTEIMLIIQGDVDITATIRLQEIAVEPHSEVDQT